MAIMVLMLAVGIGTMVLTIFYVAEEESGSETVSKNLLL